MPTLSPKILTQLMSDIFVAAGTPQEHADLVASSLVKANLAGHDSHGTVRTSQYVQMIEEDKLDPSAKPVTTQDSGVVTMMDGQKGFGQVAAKEAITLTIEKAKEHGLAATGLFNSGHVGRVGEWTMMAADSGCIGLAFVNTGRPGGLVAPFGGAAARFGTNPFSAAVPREGAPPFVLDFATSVIAEGKVRVARNAGKKLAEGRILDKDGNHTTNPQDFYEGGMLLPAADHKGYGLAMLMDLLGGILTGGGASSLPTFGSNNGCLFIVLKIEAFRPLADFLTDSAQLSENIKKTPTAKGVDEIFIAGEPELRAALDRQEGIPLDDNTWGDLVAVAERLGVDVAVVNQ